MSEAHPLPEPPQEANPPASPAQPRPKRGLEVWLDLIDRLAERRDNHEAAIAARAAQPPTRAQVLLDRMVWQIILFARWLRPRLARQAIAAKKATRSSWRRNALQAKRQSRDAGRHIHGWLLWQLRLLRTDPDRKLAALGLAGGFIVPMTLIIALGHLIPPSQPDAAFEAATTAPYSDPSVPAPAAHIIDEMPGDAPPVELPIRQQAAPVTLPPVTANSEPLSVRNFRFEYFIQRDTQGRLQLLSHAAEAMILSAYPLGSNAVDVMRFFGEVMLRSNLQRKGEADSVSRAAQARCMALPVNKVFPAKTVTCTYGHDVPLPRHARESERSRIFWILALTYDRNGKLTDLRLHARTTLATLN